MTGLEEDLQRSLDLQAHLEGLRRRGTPMFTPLSVITLVENENKFPPMMVICRAPGNDGWLAIEARTAIVYNIFDSVARFYGEWNCGQKSHVDFKSRKDQAALLARAKWFHQPVGMATVGIPKRLRSLR